MTTHQSLCPACGQPKISHELPSFIAATGDVSFRGKSIRLTPLQLDFLEILIDAYPKPVSLSRIMHELYQYRRNGENAGEAVIRTTVYNIRHVLKKAGIDIYIKARNGWGDRSGYALVLGA